MFWQYWLARKLQKGLGEIQTMTRHEFDGWFVFLDMIGEGPGKNG